MSGKAKSANFMLKTIAKKVPAHQAAHRFAALQRSGAYSELRFIQRGKAAFDIVGYRWPDKGIRRKYNIGRARINPELVRVCAWCRGLIGPKDYIIKRLSQLEYDRLGIGDNITHGICLDCAKKIKNPKIAGAATANQVLFGSRGKTLVGWINREAGQSYEITYKSGAQTKTVIRRKDKVKFMTTGKYGKPVRNVCPKTANPKVSDAVRRAIELSKQFYGLAPRHLKTTRLTWPQALIMIGPCAQVDYVSDKFDGKKRRYYHRFEGPCTIYAADKPQSDGTNLLIIRGKFKIKKEGIIG